MNYRNEQGQYHKTDGPAVIRANGTKEWYFNGERHRTDGPAIERADGTKFWYFNGTKEWYINGKRHRTDGPAIERADGTKFWFIKDNEIQEEFYYQLTDEELLVLALTYGFKL